METLVRALEDLGEAQRNDCIARIVAVLVPEWETALTPGGRRTANVPRARALTVLQNAICETSERFEHCRLPWPAVELDRAERAIVEEIVARIRPVLPTGAVAS